MKQVRVALAILLSGCVFATISCGNSTPRTLQSVTVSPSAADAQNFPNGQVQFVATGIFNKPPTHVTPFNQISAWLVRNPPANTIATINQNGLAMCVPGAAGTVTISIAVQGNGPLMDVATLTCP